ncbi:MAG: HU family DNA-binding protein [Roseovarius sp.]
MTETKAVVNGAELKKKELLDAVIERSGVRKKFAKPVVEAMIDILGEAIAEGREINLQPFGKIKHQRMVDSSNARVMVTKIRQSKSAAPALDPGDRADLEEGEDSSKESVADPAE